jgi:hypothetical protein
MKGRTYARCLATLGLDHIAAAEFFGITAKSSRRYAADGSTIPRAIVILLQYMIRHGLKPQDMVK